MSSPSEYPLDKSTDAFSNKSQTASNMQGAAEWESAMGNVAKLVSEFLASRGNTAPSGRADVVFEGLSVEGSGKSVRNSTLV